MKHNMLLTKKTVLLMLAVVGLFTTSCIKDDLAECSKLTLKAVNQNNEDITASSVSSAILYVYDENLKLLETRKLEKDFLANKEEIKFNYPEGTKLHLVAWGNLNEANEVVSAGTKADELKVSLNANDDGLASIPDELYFGSKDVETSGTGVAGGNQEIIVKIKVGSVSMATVNFQYALKNDLRSATGSEYDFYLNRTAGSYNYKGEQVGDSVYYNPESAWNETATEWMTTEEQNVCEGQKLSCTINEGNNVMREVTMAEDTEGNIVPIAVTAGNNTHIQFEWNEDGAFIGARITVTPWGVVDDNPDLKPKN